MKRDELIIWREVMPDVEKGVFGYISEHWGNKVLCYYIDNRLLERLDCGWDEHSYAKVCVESIPSSTNPNLFVNNIISKYPRAIHVFFGGLRHTLRRYLDSYLDQSSDTKIVIIAEKPLISGKLSKFKKISKKVLYHHILHKYQTDIDAFLAMGQKGVVRYKEYGYSKESIYPFMYNPLIAHGDYKTQPDVVTINNPMQFLYLGRFDYQIKGCDNLMEAFDCLNPKLHGKWKLTLVGGYGKQKDGIIRWANKRENVEFGGKWEQNEIVKNMSIYDVCLVPSKGDGWNLTPNYAIYSHIGTICSDESTSHELIENSDSGIVYKYDDIEALKNAIEFAIENEEVVKKWKQNTYKYLDKVSSETVGKYFMDIIDYTFYGALNMPKCPWIINS